MGNRLTYGLGRRGHWLDMLGGDEGEVNVPEAFHFSPVPQQPPHRVSSILLYRAPNYFIHNFIKIHRTLRTSPAMAAGVTDRLWSVEDLVALWEAYEQRRAERVA
jgi:hypothetical protein